MMETKISGFCTSFYIPAIQKLDFHLPHVCILGTNHCGELRHIAFKLRKLFQGVLCCCYYDERIVASFSHEIQSEYYVVNRPMSIEGIVLGHFSSSPKAYINSTTPSSQRHTVFEYFIFLYQIICCNYYCTH